MAKIAPHLPLNGKVATVDKDWVRTSFLLPLVPSNPKVGKLTDDDRLWLHYSSAGTKYTNTGLGGNFTINPPPKYTRFADIPTGQWVEGVVNSNVVAGKGEILRDRHDIGGMGRFYSESIDDNANIIRMRFGRPEYKGLVTFFTGFYDVEAARLAREGRGSSLPFMAGKLAGTVVGLGLFRYILMYKAAKMFLSQPSTKYYTSKPTMALYWNRVNMIALKIAMGKGIIPKGSWLPGDDRDFYYTTGMMGAKIDPTNFRHGYNFLKSKRPWWFNGSEKAGGGFDIQAILGRVQRVSDISKERLEQIAMSCNSPEEVERKVLSTIMNNGYDKRVRAASIDVYLDDYFKSRLGSLDYAKPDPFIEETKNRIGQARAEWGLGGGPTGPQVDPSVGGNGTTPTGPAPNSPTGTGLSEQAKKVVNSGAGNGIFSSGVSNNLTASAEDGTAAAGTPSTNQAAAGYQTNTNIPVARGSANAGTGLTAPASGDDYDAVAHAYASYDGQIFPVFIPDTDANTGEATIKRSETYVNSPDLIDYFTNKAKGYNEWLVLNVTPQDSISESFSNNTSQSEIQSKINGMASANQAARFSLSDFNTGFGVIDTIIDGIKDTISGVASGVMLDGLVAMTGTGFVDIPERWDSSTADISSSTSYTMQLRTPYGNKLSQFVNLDVPLACMLAASLPISHGNQAYGEPFLVELYNPGKNVIRLGMITSLSITRGTGNMGWSPDGNPLGIDISFTVKDLSTALHAPLDVNGHSKYPWKGLFPTDNAFHDYMSVLGNMSIEDMTLNTERLYMNIAQKLDRYRNMVSPYNIANIVMDNKVGRTITRISQEMGHVNDTIK